MRQAAVLSILTMAFTLVAASGPAQAQAQAAFKIPFKFESGGKKLPAGDYLVRRTGEAQLTFLQVATGKETVLATIDRLKPAQPPAADPRIVFNEMGAFEPSYTEYFTIYVVAEVWLSAQEGYLIHLTKGAHKTQVVKGEAKKK